MAANPPGEAVSPVPGVVLLDKPPDVTSFSALRAVKQAASTRKVGHTGTLDPFATGLLIALVRGATRAASFFNGLPKTYHTTFRFGSATDTDDGTGTCVRTAPLPPREAALDGLTRFRGEIDQTPPAFSAVHVNGRRAHELARKGEDVELRSRRVVVSRLDVLDARAPDGDPDFVLEIDVDIECSTGTYVRSIARDLGDAVGSAAHVTTLRRVAIGPFDVRDAVPPDELDIGRDLVPLHHVLKRIPGLRCRSIDDEIRQRALRGQVLRPAELAMGPDSDDSNDRDEYRSVARTVLVHDDVPVAIVHVDPPGSQRVRYDMVFAPESGR